MRAKIARVNHRVAYWRTKVSNTKEKDTTKQAKYIHEIKALKQDLFASHLQNAELRETLDTEMNAEICTLEGRSILMMSGLVYMSFCL